MYLRFPKVLPAVLLALAVSCAQAQGATMTVPGIGQVLTGTDMKQTMACRGGAVSISGSSNKVTLTGSCTQITVNGSDNQVTAATVGKIVLVGSDNKLTWHKAMKGSKPAVSATGSGNKVSKR
jgi:Protein of unknown function (DUF3060)